LIGYLRGYIWRKWLRRRDIKLSADLAGLRKDASLMLEEGVSIAPACMAFRTLRVGARSYIRGESELLNISVIGRFCSIGNGVILGQEKQGHPLNWVSTHPFQFTNTDLHYDGQVAPAEIGHDVWIGREAMVMEGVKVGTGAVIATRAVVTRDVPPYAVVAGIPARIVRYRHTPEVIAQLLACAWWEMPVALLLRTEIDQPEAFLRGFPPAARTEKALYRTVLIQRQGCRDVSSEAPTGMDGR
jgi:chloramphenicol O-acetyltransferase type B